MVGGGSLAGGIPWAGSTPLPPCTVGWCGVIAVGSDGSGCQAGLGFAALWEKADPPSSPELSLHPGIRFQHLLALHRGKVLRVCPSNLCPCPLRSSSLSEESKQTPESSFLPLCYKPGSCVPLCLGKAWVALLSFPIPKQHPAHVTSSHSLPELCLGTRFLQRFQGKHLVGVWRVSTGLCP